MTEYKPTKFMASGSYYDKEAADRAVNFIQCLKHSKGVWAGKNFMLLPWQEQITRDLFGVKREDGARQFRTAYIEIPKKQGKSEFAAAIALYLLCGDNEPGAEVYSCAADRAQASIVFNVATEMVEHCPPIARRVKQTKSSRRLFYAPSNSSYQVLSADVKTKHGYNVHGLIFDELHAQPNRKLFDVMTKGSGDARRQPLFFLITTAGDDVHSVCYEQHTKALDIINGKKIDPTFYPVVYGAADDDDWTSEETWRKANPSLGHTVQIETVRAACLSAQNNPAEENAFRQLRLNQWVKQAVRWMPMHLWDACNAPVDLTYLKGRPCYAGLDLSSTTDITALTLVFPPLDVNDRSEPYSVLPLFWIPEDTLKLRVSRDHVPYDLWAQQGYLHLTEGNVIHYAAIEETIKQLNLDYNIREIVYDRWGATQMSQNLDNEGFTVVPFGQGFRDMSPPTKELMKLVLEKRIAHGGHPVLSWMMDNVCVRKDPAGNIKPDKERSTEKIDGVVALVMGLDRAIRCGGRDSSSVYNERGLFIM